MSLPQNMHKSNAGKQPDELDAFVGMYSERRELFLSVVRQHGSPLYVIEEQTVLDRARAFTEAFRSELPGMQVYYALKSNSHPLIVAAVVKAGLGLDVSSGEELRLALEAGAQRIVFSGPAKTGDELGLAIRHRDRVTVLLDSLGELERLEHLAKQENATIRAGVRLTTDERGLWRKFGIALADLAGFIEQAMRATHVDLRGLQFHTSWNMDPTAHVAFVGRLGAALRLLPAAMRTQIEFIDIGGGYWPPPGSWSLEPLSNNSAGATVKALGCRPARSFQPAAAIGEFARRIGAALKIEVFPHIRCQICAEPGRWICNDSMHILLSVLDRKGEDIAITDAGTNTVGWERYESEFFPVINLSRPGPVERPFHVLGALCTPHDVWGYSYYGNDIRTGDVLLIPAQGAYTYSLRQHFIKPLPRTVLIRTDGSTLAWEDARERR